MSTVATAEPRPQTVSVGRGTRVAAWADGHPAVLLVLSAAVAVVAYAVQIFRSPDFSLDETHYTEAAQNVDLHNSLSWSAGPILVHPPLFFLLAGAWQRLTGTTHSPVLSALHETRVLNVGLCVLCVVLVGVVARALSPTDRPAVRGMAVTAAMLITTFDGFMLRYGRTVVLEPLAIAAGLLIVWAGHRLEGTRAAIYLPAVGGLIGVGCLVKQTVLFAALTPLLAAVLQRDWRRTGRAVLALLIGGAIWCSFPLWAVFNGGWNGFQKQEFNSVQRLLGLVQTTGLNLPHVSPVADFIDTLWLYISGYSALLVGGVGLVVLVVTTGVGRARDWRIPGAPAWVVAFGVLSYGWVGYSFVFGQANQHLTIYGVAASALLCSLPWAYLVTSPAGATDHADPAAGKDAMTAGPRGPRRTRAAAAFAAVVVALAVIAPGVGSWVHYFVIGRDDGTVTVAAYLADHLPACAPVNATGDAVRWQAAVADHPMTSFKQGPAALAAGVHVFLTSPKDAQYLYGASSPALTAWIEAHGREVFSAPSTSYASFQVWTVGTVVAPTTTTGCVPALPAASTDASASGFLGLSGAAVVLDALALVAGVRRVRTTRSR